MEEQKYYIISKQHMRRNEQNFILWDTNFRGYTIDAAKAGQYTLGEVRAKYGDEFPIVEDNFYYYIHKAKIDNFLIPVDEEILKKIGVQKVTVLTYL